jgi:hypothetical protein
MKTKISAAILFVIIFSVVLVPIVALTVGNNAKTSSMDSTPTPTVFHPQTIVRYYIENSTEGQYAISGGKPDSYITRWVINISISSNYPVTLSLWDFHINYETSGQYIIDHQKGGIKIANGSTTVTAWNLNQLITTSDGQPGWISPYQNLTIESGKPFSYTLRYASFNQTCIDSIVSYYFRYSGPEYLSFIKSQDPL